jgi:DNA-directed RNA polymerase omega subunit
MTMIQDIEKSLNFIEDKYSLVLVASKRARSIAFGSKTFINKQELGSSKPSECSIKEIANGFINNSNFNLTQFDTSNTFVTQDVKVSTEKQSNTGGITRFKKFVSGSDNVGMQYENIEEEEF